MTNLAANSSLSPQVWPVSQRPEQYRWNCINSALDNKESSLDDDRFVFPVMQGNNIFQYFHGAEYSNWQISETNPEQMVATNSIKALFNYYYEEWEEETKYQSSTDVIASSSFFNEIVALGKDAVPYIIEVLRDSPSFLIIALYKITGENPVKPDHRGRIKEMAGDWIEWWDKESSAWGWLCE
jgi:hypothetical protein